MKQELFAPPRTKAYVNQPKYIIIQSNNKVVLEALRILEKGREDRNQIARPELFAFKTKGNPKILHFNKFTLAILSRMLRKYPDEVMVFIGDNYWFAELPQEIQKYANYECNNKHLLNKMEKEA